MVRGRLEISAEKSGARGFQKNGARGLQTKWGQRFAEKMGPGCRPILLTATVSELARHNWAVQAQMMAIKAKYFEF